LLALPAPNRDPTDASVHSLTDPVSPPVFEALATVAGKEDVAAFGPE
jgi:hypothetical protein